MQIVCDRIGNEIQKQAKEFEHPLKITVSSDWFYYWASSNMLCPSGSLTKQPC